MSSFLTSLKGQVTRRRYDIKRRSTYLKARQKLLENTVLFESFQGKVVGDSPYEIAREIHTQFPALTLYWTVKDSSVTTPPWLTPVVFGSDKWLQLLATCKYLVNNAVFPWYFSKRSGQVYLQTWHGTPLKRIVNDVTSGAASRGYKLTVTREATMWDYLISPSQYSTDCFTTAFDFHGTFIQGGYPRNDRLVNHTPEERRQIRSALGIDSDSTRVILYAPTWRPNLRNADGSWSVVDLFDCEIPEGSILLYRGHTNMNAISGRAQQRRIDVSAYPDVNDLLIAADVLVTDYSSIMFDFSITGKPVSLLIPDIDAYAQDPGFYFDVRTCAPGPFFSTAVELVDALTNSADVQTGAYKEWQQRFVSEEDGQATKRAVKALFSRQ
jgi:CDP-glycerol glycerophosphotransferase